MTTSSSGALPRIVHTVDEVRAVVTAARARNARVAFVPTMGALHEGHLALVMAARREVDSPPPGPTRPGGVPGCVVVSIFVNPTQFGPHEDYQRYPRDLPADAQLCGRGGADLVFAPAVAELYPPGHQTVVEVPALSEPLCGLSRAGHFRGVATVVTMLLGAVRPDLAIFGRKDYQQLQVVRRLVRDLHLGVAIIGHPTVREPDGLALSSRNRYLDADERAQAPLLHRALEAADRSYLDGERSVAALLDRAGEILAQASLARLDYLELRDAETLAAVGRRLDARPAVLALAAFFGKARLIDNLVLGDVSPTSVR